MLPIRIKACSESDLRMLGNLARNIQRVIAVTQADIDAAAAQGKAWVVKPVVKVSDPLDNLRGGTQLVIKQNSILPGQNVMRVMYIGGQAVVVGPGTSPLSLPDAAEEDILSLIAFGGTKQGLPNGYTQLEYIESTGTQYIDTGYKSSNNTKVKAQIACPNFATFVFGSRNNTSGDNQKRFGLFFNTTWNPQYANQSLSPTEQTIVNTIYNVEMSKDGFVVDGQSLSTFSSATFTGDYNMYLFANNTADTTIGYGSCKIYGFEVYTNNILEHKYIPAKNSSNVLGMYDLVSGQFFTNQGTGDFIAGGEAVPTPDAPMDIVSNNGVLKAFKTLNISTYDTSASDAGIDITFDGVTDRRRWSTLNDGGTGTNHYKNGFVSIYMNQNGNNYFAKALVNGVVYNGSIYNTGEQIDTWSYTAVKNINIYCPATNADGTVETIGIRTRNLFDGQWQQGVYNTSTGTYTPNVNNRICNVNMIQVKPSTTYTVSCPDYALASGMRWLFYDANKNFISTITTGVATITTPANAKYINFYIANNLTVAAAPDLQIEQGTTVTDYIPYNDSTAVAEMLLKVGDIADQQEIIDGTVTRKIGIKVLDGTEGWTRGQSFYCNALTGVLQTDHSCYCTHFQGIMNNSPVVVDSNTCRVGYHIGSDIAWDRLYIYADRSLYATAQDFADYLADQYAAGTPVIVIYPLETPTTESVTAQPMQTVEGDNTAEITQASLDNLELQVEYIEA